MFPIIITNLVWEIGKCGESFFGGFIFFETKFPVLSISFQIVEHIHFPQFQPV